MACTRLLQTKDGRQYYEIICHKRGRGQKTTRWYVPEGWSKTSIEKELIRQVSAFESKFLSGDILTRDEAAAKRAAEEARRAAEEAERAKIKTFKQYCELVYIPALEVTAAAHTISSFNQNLKNHIYPAIGQIKMPDIESAELSALLLKAQSTLAIGSVVKLYTILRLVFKKAYNDNMISRNPMDKVERPKAKKEEVVIEEPESYTEEEVEYIKNCLKDEPLQWKCYVYFLIDTGCRRGEACGVKWEDVDFKNGSVKLTTQIAYTPEDGVYIDTLKSRKQRKVYFARQETIDLLRELKKEKEVKDSNIIQLKNNNQNEQEDNLKTLEGNWVFTQIESQSKEKTVYSRLPLHPDSPTRYFKKFGKKYNIDHFHPHKCRHTMFSLSLTNGGDVVSVSKRGGHSNPATTYRFYSHASEESQKRAAKAYGEALNGNKKEKEENIG